MLSANAERCVRARVREAGERVRGLWALSRPGACRRPRRSITCPEDAEHIACALPESTHSAMLSAMDMRANLVRVRELMGEITGIQTTYGAGDRDAHALPGGVNVFPAVLVFPGSFTEYIQYAGAAHRHTYTVTVQIFVGGAGEPLAVYDSIPYIDTVLEKFAQNVTLGGRTNWLRLTGWDWGNIEFGGGLYIGWDLSFEVSEESPVTFAGGQQ